MKMHAGQSYNKGNQKTFVSKYIVLVRSLLLISLARNDYGKS